MKRKNAMPGNPIYFVSTGFLYRSQLCTHGELLLPLCTFGNGMLPISFVGKSEGYRK